MLPSFFPLSFSLSLCLHPSNNVRFESAASRCSFLRSMRRNIREEAGFRIFLLRFESIASYIHIHIYIRVINPVVGLRARCGFTSICVTLAFTCRHFVPRLIDNNQVSFSHAWRRVKRKIRAIVVRASVTRYVTCVHVDTTSRESYGSSIGKRR